MPSGQPWPVITIVTPSFQQGRFLENTIRSVLLQGYPALQYVILDGGSTDESLPIIRRYERFVSAWVSEPDGGQVDAIEKGFAATTGEWWTWINSDDWLMPGALRAVAEAALAHPEAGILVGGGIRLDEQDREMHRLFRTQDQISRPIFWSKNNFMQPSTFIRRSTSLSVGPIDPSIPCAFDFDYWVRASRTVQFATVPHLLSGERHHADARTVSQKPRMYRELISVVRREVLPEEQEEAAAMIRYFQFQFFLSYLPPGLQQFLHRERVRVQNWMRNGYNMFKQQK